MNVWVSSCARPLPVCMPASSFLEKNAAMLNHACPEVARQFLLLLFTLLSFPYLSTTQHNMAVEHCSILWHNLQELHRQLLGIFTHLVQILEPRPVYSAQMHNDCCSLEIIHNYGRIGNLHPNLSGVTENMQLQKSCQAVTTLKPLTAEIINSGHLSQNPEPKTAIKHQLCWRSLKQETTREWCGSSEDELSGVDLISKFPSFPIQSYLPKLIQYIEVFVPQGLKFSRMASDTPSDLSLGKVNILYTLSHSYSSSWVVFAVRQHPLSCWAGPLSAGCAWSARWYQEASTRICRLRVSEMICVLHCCSQWF